MSPSLFHLSISGAFLRNLLPATPRLFGFRPPDLVVWKMYPQSPEKNGYMWYASPPEPCWTASPTGAPVFFLTLSAVVSSCAHVLGTFASFRLTKRPTFSSCVGIPYSRAPFFPYENALSEYFGNCARTAFRGKSGRTSPFAASSPVQSCAPTITSGASLVATVFRLSRIDPKSLTTTLTSTPRVLPQALVTLSTSAFLFWSVHTTIVVAWLAAAPSWAAGAIGASTSIAAAKAAASVTTPTRVMRFFMFEPSPVFGLTEASLVSRSWRGQRAVRPIFVRART